MKLHYFTIMKSALLRRCHEIKSDSTAVIELPLYLVVTIIIGIVVLGSILSMMMLPSYLDPTVSVTVKPQIAIINNTTTPLHYHVLVQDPNHQPIANAHVIIKNDYTISTNTTTNLGQTNVTLTPSIPQGIYETYYDVIVKTPDFQPFHQKHLLKVILRH